MTAIEKAHALAKKARENAHAPYSKYKVGCCLKLKDRDDFVVGANVENAAYPNGQCSEASAIGNLISNYGKVEIEFVVVVADNEPNGPPPCGQCRQILSEFCPLDTPIYMASLTQIGQQTTMGILLPGAYDSSHLPEK